MLLQYFHIIFFLHEFLKCTSYAYSGTVPQHDAAIYLLYNWDSVSRRTRGTMVIMAKQFDFSLIRSQSMSPEMKVLVPVCIFFWSKGFFFSCWVAFQSVWGRSGVNLHISDQNLFISGSQNLSSPWVVWLEIPIMSILAYNKTDKRYTFKNLEIVLKNEPDLNSYYDPHFKMS